MENLLVKLIEVSILGINIFYSDCEKRIQHF